MSEKNIVINIENAFAWQFENIPEIKRGVKRTNERIRQLQSDVNIGFEKKTRIKLLENLEYLLRDDQNIRISIPLMKTPDKSPHYLDDENDHIDLSKVSYQNISIERVHKGKFIEIYGKELKLKFDKAALYELFTRLYIAFEIYATSEDNTLIIKSSNSDYVRLVIWGVINGKPIFY